MLKKVLLVGLVILGMAFPEAIYGASYTPNLRLKKPTKTETGFLDAHNSNMQVIDTKVNEALSAVPISSLSYGTSVLGEWIADPSITTDQADATTAKSLAKIISDLSGASVDIRLPTGTYNIWRNYTVPAGIHLEPDNGVTITPSRSIRETALQWTASGSGTSEYYLELSGGGNPGVYEPSSLYANSAVLTAGTVGSLTAGTWDWADNDGLGFSTIYVRLSDSTDPDTKAAGYIEAWYTLTINGPFEAGPYQVFSGTGTVTGLKTVNAAWWGASPTATAATNATAIQAALTAATAHGCHFILPPGDYESSSALSVDGTALAGGYLLRANFDFQGNIQFNGCSGLSFRGMQNCRIKINHLSTDDRAAAWAGTFYGLKLDTFTRSDLDIEMIYGFEKGLYMYADATMLGYVNVKLGEIIDNKYALYYYQTGGGAINQINYIGGRLALYVVTKAATTGSYGVYFAVPGSRQYNNHMWNNTCLENLHNGVYGGNQLVYSTFISPRFENVDANWLEAIGQGITWIKGAENLTAAYLASKLANIGIGARAFTIVGNYNGSGDTTNLSSLALDEEYGGISWFYRSDPTNISLLKRSYSGLLYYDANTASRAQRLDKLYTGSAVPSTAGETFTTNAVIWNSSPAVGSPMGWVCSVYGTVGTLSPARTGTVTSGSKTMTVNDATSLRRGQYILLNDGVGGTQVNTIDYVSGTTVYLLTAASQTFTSATLTWRNPTWVAMAPANPGPKSGTADPAATNVMPDYIGQMYIRTDTQKVYVSYGSLSGSWVLTN